MGRKVRDAVSGPPVPNTEVAEATEQTLKDGVRRMVDVLGPEITAWRGDERTRELLRGALGQETAAEFGLAYPAETHERVGDLIEAVFAEASPEPRKISQEVRQRWSNHVPN